jgi:hypothetical protein
VTSPSERPAPQPGSGDGLAGPDPGVTGRPDAAGQPTARGRHGRARIRARPPRNGAGAARALDRTGRRRAARSALSAVAGGAPGRPRRARPRRGPGGRDLRRHGRPRARASGDGDLSATMDSLAAQSSPRWRALVWGIADTADQRITAVTGDDTETTTWLASHGRALTILLRGGDRLAPECVYEVALAVHRAPQAELVTWDDDVAVGRHHRDPRFRPSWSPELLWARTTSVAPSHCAHRRSSRPGGSGRSPTRPRTGTCSSAPGWPRSGSAAFPVC